LISGKFIASICSPGGVDIIEVGSGTLLQAIREKDFISDFFHAVWCDANDSSRLLVCSGETVYLYQQIVINHVPILRWRRINETTLTFPRNSTICCCPSFSYPWIVVAAVAPALDSEAIILVRNIISGRTYSVQGVNGKHFTAGRCGAFIRQSPSGYAVALAVPLEDGASRCTQSGVALEVVAEDGVMVGAASEKTCFGSVQLFSGAANMTTSGTGESQSNSLPLLHSYSLEDINTGHGTGSSVRTHFTQMHWRRCTIGAGVSNPANTGTAAPVRELLYTMDSMSRIRLFAVQYYELLSSSATTVSIMG
jgi:hypothetical protein